MKVLFLQNIKGTALIGDIKDVADGFARNYLFPRGFARPANAQAVTQSEELKKKRAKVLAESKQGALELAEKLKDIVIEITTEANDEGVLYGSITAHDIADKLKEQSFNIDSDAINLKQHIKRLGEYPIEVELHPEVIPTITLKVVTDEK